MTIRQTLRSLDWILLAAALLLLLLGLAMLLSAASAEGGIGNSRFLRQAIAGAVALALFFVVSCYPYHKLRRYAAVLYGLGLVGLLFVTQFGRVIRGTTSRLEISGVQVQPSEFMKIGLVLVLAWLFAQRERLTTRTNIITAAATGLAVALVLLEPDLGVAALVGALWISLITFLGVSWRTLAVLALIIALGMGAAWHWGFADYQKQRVVTFLDPASDPLGAGYNVTQSIVALGSGMAFGRGLGQGPQSRLEFLPERHTDFMLASIGEELGFVGILLVITLYSVLLWRILKVAGATNDRFGKLLCVGVYFLLLLSFFVSAGMNMGLLPVTGIPLPLVSYGGSNLVSTFVLLGIVESVRVNSKWARSAPAELTHFT